MSVSSQGRPDRVKEFQAGTGMAGQRWVGRDKDGHSGAGEAKQDQGESSRDKDGQAGSNAMEETEAVL